jgi:hypothetical protein
VVPPTGGPSGPVSGPGEAPAGTARDISNAPFVPARLRLPSGRTAVVRPAETSGDGSLLVPEDPSRVGWWTGGARAGDPYGSVVLAGHVDSRRFGIGVLAELAGVRRGQLVQVVADGQSRSYRVASVRRVRKARLAAGTDVFDQSGAPRLVLVTCGGAFDRSTHTYADNLVVVATPVA